MNVIKQIGTTENNQFCPRCGGQLVLCTARKGENAGNQFYGCSNSLNADMFKISKIIMLNDVKAICD